MHFQPRSQAHNRGVERGPDYVHFWIKFFIQTIVLKVSRKKNPKCLPAC